MTDAVIADYRTAPIDEKLRAMLGYIEKVSRTPSEVAPADVRAVLAAGVSRQAIRDGLAVQAAFENITRLADAFGFAIPDQTGFDKGANALLRFGYKL